MLFGKKPKQASCHQCKSKFDDKFNFCPFCGVSRIDQDDADFGMLGKRDMSDSEFVKRNNPMNQNLGVMDKIMSSMVNSLMKNMVRELEKAEVQNSKNGIRISFGNADKKNKEQKQKAKTPTAEQLHRFASLPKVQAKTNVKRLSDKVVYELNIPGITTPENILVSRLESGYEIKAIGQEKEGKEKVYINSLPITLPIKSFTIDSDKLLIEFNARNEQ